MKRARKSATGNLVVARTCEAFAFMGKLPAEMTIEQYAAHRSCTANAVFRALRAGRIRHKRTEGRARLLEPVECDANWDLKKTAPRTWELARESAVPPVAPKHSSSPADVGGDDADTDEAKVTADDRPLWQARKERALALKHERDNRLRDGELIEMSEVNRVYIGALTALKTKVLAVPADIAPDVAATSERRVAEVIMLRSLRTALDAVADAVEAAVAAVADDSQRDDQQEGA